MTTVAHLSDLHLGRSVEMERAAVRLRDDVLRSGADVVVISGDLTHRGRASELAMFEEIFEPLAQAGRLVVVPGNRDRQGNDVAQALMPTGRVCGEQHGGAWFVRVDSTALHRSRLSGAGRILEEDLEAIDDALDATPPGMPAALVLHHQVRPRGDVFDQLARFSSGDELAGGAQLLALIRGRCDLLLFGHSLVPTELVLFPDDDRPLAAFGAGASTELQRFRLLGLRGGRMCFVAFREVGEELPTVLRGADAFP